MHSTVAVPPDSSTEVSIDSLSSSPKSSRSHWRTSLLVLSLLWALIYIVDISRPPLMDDVDSVHAEAGREMVARGDWVTIYTDGIRYMEKAPLMPWSLAVSYELFGISEWSTRLPLMLGVLALVLATWRLGSYVYGERSGFYAGLTLVTSLGVYLYTRFPIPEVWVALWLTLGYYFFLKALEQEQPSRLVCWGFAATCAVNVLTKGLIGLVFPVGTIGLYLLLTGNLRKLLKMRLISSLLVFVAIAAPWHVLAAIRTPAQGQAPSFLWLYFINEHVMRFLGKRQPPGFDTVPLGIFWLLTFVWMFPWIAFLPQSLRDVWASWRRRHQLGTVFDRRSAANLVFFLWPLVILIFFSFSTRQEYYTLPGLPGMALLLGAWLARESEPEASPSDQRAGRISSTGLLVLGVLAFAIGVTLFLMSHRPPPGVELADLLKKNPDEYNLSLGHVLDLTTGALGAFRAPLLGVSLAFLLGTGLNWLFRRRGRAFAGNVALVTMTVVLLGCIHFAFITFSPILSSYDLAQAIKQRLQPGDVIVIDGEYHEASTLNFYTGQQVHVLHEPSGNLWYGGKFPDAPPIFETEKSLIALWNGPERVFLWSDHAKPKELDGLKAIQVAESGGKFIFTNKG